MHACVGGFVVLACGRASDNLKFSHCKGTDIFCNIQIFTVFLTRFRDWVMWRKNGGATFDIFEMLIDC